MSTVSTLVKGWCLTVTTAALGFGITANSRGVALLGGLVVLLFGFLDARYLREERRFRALYEGARHAQVGAFEMNTRLYVEGDSCDSSLASSCLWRSVLRSWSLWAFYGPLLLVAVAVLIRALVNQ